MLQLLVFAGLTALFFSACDKYSDENCIHEPDINPNAACPYNYAPVCGCNDITYANDCAAQAAGLQFWTEGECN